MYMINEKTTALTMYEQGNLDFMDESHSIPTLDKPRLAKLPEYKLVPQLRGEYYGFAVDRKPFDNPKLRRAFSLAIDREVFPKILQGGNTPATSWIPPGMLAHNPKIGLSFNPEAKRAGFWPRLVIPTAKACRLSSSAITPKRTTSWLPKRFRRCGKRP